MKTSNQKLQVSKINSINVKEELSKKIQPFNLSSAPLFWIEILEISEDERILFLDFHHIISDGISISLFLDELFKVYHEETLPELEIQVTDYIHWENKNIKLEKTKKQLEYWLQQFKDEVPVLNFPADFARPSLMDYHGKKLDFKIDKTLSTKLRKLAKHENTSLFTILLAVYNVLLSKYTGQEDIVVGVPVAGRNHSQLQSLIGMFVNNLALRNQPKGSLTFKDFLSQTQSTTLQSFNNQDYSFGKLVEQIEQKRDVSRNSLFDTMFIYQNLELPQCQKENLSIEHYFFDPGFSKYDISLEVFDQKETINYYIEYSTALFKEETIIRFANHFENLLNSIVQTPNVKLSDLSIIKVEEFNKLVIDFNKTKYDYPKEKVIHELIEELALKNPDGIAVDMGRNPKEQQATTCKLQEITYKELNEKSNQLAHLLRIKGVAPNIPVAIILDRKPELIIAILGILKAGGCFLPIDKDLPEERIKYILSDSQTKLLITDTKSLKLSGIQHGTLDLKPESIININNYEEYSQESKTITNINSPTNLAYIIYTSGTTGNPKGVMVEHKSLINYACWARKTYIPEKEEVSFPLYTSISFDLTITSIFVPLISGNTIITYPDNDNFILIEEVLLDNRVSIIKVTPSHLKIIKESNVLKSDDYKSKLKCFIVGGEVLTTLLAKEIHEKFEKNVEIFNEYGPTEATVGCMFYRCNVEIDKGETVPIGVPINNTQIFLLDKYLKSVPTGVVGEMYISGDCLARGYLFNPDLTNQKFVDYTIGENQKIYKTGDFAKRLSNGNIEFIGREDQQVKINGYRIELEEIEKQILNLQDVVDVVDVVVAEKRNQGDESFLCAYIVIEEMEREKGDAVSCIKNKLSNLLPQYMIPKHFILIDSVPLTNNGKINYHLLPEPGIEHEGIKVAGRNDIEKTMISIWHDVLSEKEIGIIDNFFELGGDSIKAVQIASRLFDKNISVNVKDILTYQTIEQLCLHAEITDGTTQYEQGIVEGEVELNPIQGWFFEQDFKNPHFYNQSVLLKFKKPINKEILQKTFKVLIKHHDGLRLNYSHEKRLMFYNNVFLEEDFIVNEYVGNDIQRKGIQNLCQQIKSSFDITNSLLIKAALLKEKESDLLFITAHHLIIDGISWRILLKDFYKVYNSLEKGKRYELSKKTASIKDWDERLQLYSQSEIVQKEKGFWNNIEKCEYRIPKSEITGKGSVKDLNRAEIQVNKKETEFLLKDAHKVYNIGWY